MNFEHITFGEESNIAELSAMASRIVKEHFDPIIGAAQNDYMIERFQSVESIREQLAHGYQYYFVNEGGERVGFLAFYPRGGELYLSKFYLKKECRGRGWSRPMLDFVIAAARREGLSRITLNVNRSNDAIFAYEKLGFRKIREEVTDIGGGFVMDDFVYAYGVGRQAD